MWIMMKYILTSALVGLAVGVGTVLFGAAWVSVPAKETPAPPPPNNPGTISQQNHSGLVCFGSVDVEGGVLSLYPVVQGRVATIPVSEGQTVQAGTVLLHLVDRLARFQVQ
jgi:multidrug efflux pump subunit AcrA (membrane-fusion protein)